MLTGIDHIVIAVNDLLAATAAFQQAGFSVTPGGSHPTGTHNVLIPFADGSYLELIAVEDADLAKDHPWFAKLAGKQGFATFALGADPLDYEVERLTALGIAPVDARDGARARPDGTQLQWKSVALAADPPVALPFLIQDVTPRSLRVPSGAAVEHKNGIKGTTGLTMVVGDLKTSTSAYGKMLGTPVAALDHGFEGVAQGWRVFAQEYWVDLIAPPAGESPLADYHQTYGDSIYQIYLTVDSGPEFPASRIDIPGFPDLHILTTN
jgi:hypothetical protein